VTAVGVLAACHLHSTWSYDGSWTLDALAERFGARGYRVIMVTEHDRGFSQQRYEDFREDCARASSDRILVLPGIEYSDSSNRIHVLVWGRIPFLGEGLPTPAMLDAVKSERGAAVLAHPSRRAAWQVFDPSWCDGLVGVEIWNRKYDGWAPSDMAPALVRSQAVPFVGLDFHTIRQSFPLAMELDVHGAITEASVLDCLRARRCAPRAFGMPLTRQLFRKSMPLLNVAEHGRRTLASLRRASRASSRPRL